MNESYDRYICMWSRVEDGAEGRDAPAHHAVDDLLRQLLVGDDAHRLRVELLDEAVGQLDHVRLAVFARVCDVS